MKRCQVATACAALVIMGCSSNSVDRETTGGGTGADTGSVADAGTGGDAGSTEEDVGGAGTEDVIPSDTGADTATPAAPSCAAYCAAVTAACSGDNAQYADQDACMAYCEGWAKLPAGTADDTAANTIGCRIYHAEIAAQPGNAATHCPHAGPSGGGACGSWCDNYCQLAAANCSGESELYSSEADCQAACANFSDEGGAGDTDGDTVQCRIYHLGVAGSDPEGGSGQIHCPHGGGDGGVCVDPAPTCEGWCSALSAACAGDNAQFGSEAACMSYCETSAQLQPGEIGDTSGDTIGCRTYHAGVAAGSADDAIIHCPHAGPSGGNVCGSWCDTYCDLAMLNCTGDSALFAAAADCQTACANFPTDGASGDASGDSVQCRIYHLGVAGSDMAAGSATTHCPHGGVTGGGVCEDTPSEPTCAAYCAGIMSACTGDNAQYGSQQACMDYCQTWATLPVGMMSDTDTNTIGCRMYHSGVASQSDENATIHCDHAGPSGGGVCGSWCNVYCDLATTNCAGDASLYGSSDECALACAAFSASGQPGDTDGDSVQCRIYHLGVAGSDPASGTDATHCPHGGVDGGEVCIAAGASCAKPVIVTALPFQMTVDTAGAADLVALPASCPDGAGDTMAATDAAGDIAFSFTPANDGHFAFTPSNGATVFVLDACDSGATCLGANATSMTLTLTGGTEYRVFLSHAAAGATAGSATLKIEEAAPTCAEYCAAVMGACTGENTQYDSMDACLLQCGTLSKIPAGSFGDTSGNTIGCRIYHADVAASQDAALHCEHAGASGGGICGSWCDNYCALAQTNCAGGNALYDSTEACLTACQGLPDTGPTDATAGDSVQCRIYHLGVAGLDSGAAATHCPHAALSSADGVCEDATPSCSTYCTAIQAACGDAGEATSQYADQAACMAYCQGAGDFPAGSAGAVSGNSVGCRLYHARVAALQDPAAHCGHAGPSGGNVCGSWCTNYCALAQQNCADTNALYANEDACLTACVDFSKAGNPSDTDGDSVQCRIYHLGVAGMDGDTSAGVHCPHGGPDGGGVCVGAVAAQGDSCDNPFEVTSLPYTQSGDTTAHSGSFTGLCPTSLGAGSNDAVYAFTATQDGVVTITLNAGFDSALYVLDDCAAADSCTESDDQIGSGMTETVLLSATSGQTYFIVVDGWDNSNNVAGTYTLNISAPCTPQCGGKSCGTDGCGGSCGTCGAEELCNDASSCEAKPPIPGDGCANPLPFTGASVSGDTSGMNDKVSGQDACAADAKTTLAADAVFSYTAPKTGTYQFGFATTGLGHPTLITVALNTGAVACDNFGTSCLGSSGDLFSGGSLEIDLQQDQAYLIIVDGIFLNDTGPFTLEVTEPAPPAAPTYSGQVQAILQNRCTGCHTGGGSGGHNIASSYSEVTKSNSGGSACAGTSTVGECAVKRIMNGSMPLGGSVPADEKAIIQSWADAGFLQ